MKKQDAKQRIVSEKVGNLSYKIYENKRYWSKSDVNDLRACFLLSHTPSYYYPDQIASIFDMVDTMHNNVYDHHTEEEIKELNKLRDEVGQYCEERDIAIYKQ